MIEQMRNNSNISYRRKQRGMADAVPLAVMVLVFLVGGAFLVTLIASVFVPAVKLRGKNRWLTLGLVAAFWGGLYWWNSGEPERLKLTMSDQYKHFKTLCEQSGIKVYRRADNVDSVAFQAQRASTTKKDLLDPNFPGDVYGEFDLVGGERAEQQLVNLFLTKKEWESRWYVPTEDVFLRYPQVEVAVHSGGTPEYSQYLDASKGSMQQSVRTVVPAPSSQYLIQWQDISTPQDRKHWIAGSKWTISEIKSGEVLAERVGYAIDLFHGVMYTGPTGAGGEPRPPWERAGSVQSQVNNVGNSCPAKPSHFHNLDFVRSVLRPVPQKMIVR